MRPKKSKRDTRPGIQQTCDSRQMHHVQSQQTLQFHCTAQESVSNIAYNICYALTSTDRCNNV